MRSQQSLPEYSTELTGQVLVLEARTGSARSAVLQNWLEAASKRGARVELLPCNFEKNGIWAGLRELLLPMIPRLKRDAPHLVDKHSYELSTILPELRRTITVRNASLTDTSPDHEKVRNFPIDRAYRIAHGVIDLLEAYRDSAVDAPWVMACDDYHRAGALVRRFFTELMRRRGRQLNLTLLVAVAPGAAPSVADSFGQQFSGQIVRLDLPEDVSAPVAREEMTRKAQELEARVDHDPIESEIHLQQLINYWSESSQPERGIRWKAMAIGTYNHLGLYEDAIFYSESVGQHLDTLCGRDHNLRWNIVGNLFGCHIAAGNVKLAQQIVEREALTVIDDISVHPRIYYVMAMLYSRFLPPAEQDLKRAAKYVEHALECLSKAVVANEQRHFLTAFLKNGLAFIRHRQGRPADGIALCKEAMVILNEHLGPEQHRLHRSVLFYNIAQVYSMTGPFDEAIEHFTAALEMDPNYSEYHNDRGSIYMKLGELDKALQDYLTAIELSPPYPEVLTNLGQCYRLMERPAEAAAAYTRSLDLNPNQILALVGRAQSLEEQGQMQAALEDYTAALVLNPEQPFVLGNRAILHFELQHLDDALEDLNRAVKLSPQTPDLYQNRAVALSALERFDDAACDLEAYLRLCPDAEDRDEVLRQLASLAMHVPVA
jgi:tetratricopeptide (TPR) repeat protein